MAACGAWTSRSSGRGSRWQICPSALMMRCASSLSGSGRTATASQPRRASRRRCLASTLRSGRPAPGLLMRTCAPHSRPSAQAWSQHSTSTTPLARSLQRRCEAAAAAGVAAAAAAAAAGRQRLWETLHSSCQALSAAGRSSCWCEHGRGARVAAKWAGGAPYQPCVLRSPGDTAFCVSFQRQQLMLCGQCVQLHTMSLPDGVHTQLPHIVCGARNWQRSDALQRPAGLGGHQRASAVG